MCVCMNMFMKLIIMYKEYRSRKFIFSRNFENIYILLFIIWVTPQGGGNASRSNTYCLNAEVMFVIAFLKAGLWVVLPRPELETFHLHAMQYVGEAEVPWATVPRLIPHWADAADRLESEWLACYLSMSSSVALGVHIWKIKEYSEVWMARSNQTMLSWCLSRAF